VLGSKFSKIVSAETEVARLSAAARSIRSRRFGDNLGHRGHKGNLLLHKHESAQGKAGHRVLASALRMPSQFYGRGNAAQGPSSTSQSAAFHNLSLPVNLEGPQREVWKNGAK
jgi:hypothetical protein